MKKKKKKKKKRKKKEKKKKNVRKFSESFMNTCRCQQPHVIYWKYDQGRPLNLLRKETNYRKATPAEE